MKTGWLSRVERHDYAQHSPSCLNLESGTIAIERWARLVNRRDAQHAVEALLCPPQIFSVCEDDCPICRKGTCLCRRRCGAATSFHTHKAEPIQDWYNFCAIVRWPRC
eukprot:scaffold16407_cov51-Attheya_sp.AAC.2